MQGSLQCSSIKRKRGEHYIIKATLSSILIDLLAYSEALLSTDRMRLIVLYNQRKREYEDHIPNFTKFLSRAWSDRRLSQTLKIHNNVEISNVATGLVRYLMPTIVDSIQGDQALLIIIDLTTVDALGFMELLSRAWVIFSTDSLLPPCHRVRRRTSSS